MGGKCCKPTFEPDRVHIKKINEIFVNCKHILNLAFLSVIINCPLDLKNQGIDLKSGNKGSEKVNI